MRLAGRFCFAAMAPRSGGWEPFYQCLSLAAALQRRRRGTHFLSYLDPLSLATVINRANNDWQPAEQPLGSRRRSGSDHRPGPGARTPPPSSSPGEGMTPDYLAALQETGALVVVFDSTAGMTFPADVVVNPLLAPGKKAYRVGPGCQRLLGHRFALCRGIFRRQRTIRATEPPAPFRALVAMGDDDLPARRSPAPSNSWRWTRSSKVSVAVRTHHPQYDELLELADGSATGRSRC